MILKIRQWKRRGQPCAYIKFGTALTLNSANLAYFEAFKMLESLPNYPEVSKIFTGNHS